MKIRRYLAVVTTALAFAFAGGAVSVAGAATTNPVFTSATAGTTTITVHWTWPSAPAGAAVVASALEDNGTIKEHYCTPDIEPARGSCTITGLSPNSPYILTLIGAVKHNGKVTPLKGVGALYPSSSNPSDVTTK